MPFHQQKPFFCLSAAPVLRNPSMISSVITTKLPAKTPWGPSKNPYIVESSCEKCAQWSSCWWVIGELTCIWDVSQGVEYDSNYETTLNIQYIQWTLGSPRCGNPIAEINTPKPTLFHALIPSKMPAMTLWPPGAWNEGGFSMEKQTMMIIK